MAARWVGQKFGRIFRRLWTKVHRCVGMSVVSDVLLRSGDIRDQVAKLCEIAPKFCFWAAKFFGEGAPKF